MVITQRILSFTPSKNSGVGFCVNTQSIQLKNKVTYLQGERGAFIEQDESFSSDAVKVKCRL